MADKNINKTKEAAINCYLFIKNLRVEIFSGKQNITAKQY